MQENTEVKALTKQAVGRPSKFKTRAVKRLLWGLSNGLEIQQACKFAGIGRTTLHDWQQQYPGLQPLLERARERAREKALAALKDIAEKDRDRQAWTDFLRFSFFQDYRSGNQVNVSANAQAAAPLVIDEATRQRLLEQREKSPNTVDAPVLQDKPAAIEDQVIHETPEEPTTHEPQEGQDLSANQLREMSERELKHPEYEKARKEQEEERNRARTMRELFGSQG